MATEKYLQYRGDVKAIAGLGGTLAFVTTHPEGQPTAVFRLDADKLGLDADPLPCGAVAVLAAENTLYISGTDSRIYQLPAKGGKPKPLGQPLPGPPGRMALLSNNRLAVLCGKQVVVLSRKDGKVLQTLDLPEAGTALAADPTGHWLVAGTARGTVAVFEDEDKPEFLLSESQKLHEGAVAALLFDPEELRFLSAGADNKLLSTHARGKLEPEDRGRGASHADLVTALAWGPADRFYSGSRDKTVKAWPRGVATRPVTVKDGVGTVVDLAMVQIHNRPHLALACDDNTLRFFPLDPAGKPGELTRKVYDGDQWARHELEQDDPR
ncbi:MAG TPA: hypothetical protein VFA26_22325, partial [Gemmataceae bacterium]|nr:hypothetical protein [Gemmataceae bacterium]